MAEEIGRKANGGGMLYPYKGIWPEIADDCFIAPGARIIGDVKIGAGSSVWFNCVLRGDVGIIRIGKKTVIQDGSVLHVDSDGFDTIFAIGVFAGTVDLDPGSGVDEHSSSSYEDSHQGGTTWATDTSFSMCSIRSAANRSARLLSSRNGSFM